ncbi:diacylglycerol kinase family protein [Alicyclobacillus cycloheptanicus]|uniref:Diacylglycerol kinase n=1 Tax=Alicyclobacillus cycloheptanicus TaxID=1457 RepID=A0ABT9XJT9_9BACL|nr:diacylglycerol kinase [Alicyclobacillus cycloheptanicus]WDM00764.1 diacylglycerol kinase family protein [Alicyclobacillus cycloheptanicus]
MRMERNMKVHFAAALCVMVFNLIVRPALLFVMLDVLACTVVISAELVNTALEALANHLAAGRQLRAIQVAKDAAAGSVLLLAAGALVVGVYVGWQTWPWQWRLLTMQHAAGMVVTLCALVLLLWAVAGAIFAKDSIRQEAVQ